MDFEEWSAYKIELHGIERMNCKLVSRLRLKVQQKKKKKKKKVQFNFLFISHVVIFRETAWLEDGHPESHLPLIFFSILSALRPCFKVLRVVFLLRFDCSLS